MNVPDPARPADVDRDRAAATIPFRDALRFWAKLGCISFGGPAGQIALMHRALVDERRWISERRFLHALHYCMLLPGPEAQQLATYLGWLMHRTVGGLAAGALFVLPSLVLLVALAWLYLAFGHTALVTGLFFGIKPAVMALVLQAAWRLGTRTLRHPALWAIALAAFVALAWGHAPFPAIVIGAGVIGAIGARLVPRVFAPPAAPPSTPGVTPVESVASPGAWPSAPRAAVIDDDTPTPSHARFSRARLLAVLGAGALLWLVPFGTLLASVGIAHPFTQMAWFFTKAALLTFGGAYAVLPYVWQGAVVEQRWLAPGQMIDGLALGETTPGPLIMVVVFVAFVGGWTTAPFGVELGWASGLVAALLVTWFTFLPSFVFILAGGPLVERTRDVPAFTGPLRAVTAAVVGVIANLALFFGVHVLWPDGFGGRFDAVSALIAVAAAVALMRLRRDPIHVIVACALVGLVWRSIG
jgi:chromate transporter